MIGFILSLIVALSFFGWGTISFVKKNRITGKIFSILGAGLAISSFWIAEAFYALILPQTVFIGMLFSLLGLVVISYWFGSELLAVFTTLLALIVPFLLKTHSLTTSDFALYLALVNIGALFALLFGRTSLPMVFTALYTSMYQIGVGPIIPKALLHTASGVYTLLLVAPWLVIPHLDKEKWSHLIPGGNVIIVSSFISFFALFHSYTLVLGAFALCLMLSLYFFSKKEMVYRSYQSIMLIFSITATMAVIKLAYIFLSGTLFFSALTLILSVFLSIFITTIKRARELSKKA